MIITIKPKTMLSHRHENPSDDSMILPLLKRHRCLRFPINLYPLVALRQTKSHRNPCAPFVSGIRFYYFKRIADPVTITVSISSFALPQIPSWNSPCLTLPRNILVILISIFICLSASTSLRRRSNVGHVLINLTRTADPLTAFDQMKTTSNIPPRNP